MLTYKINNTRVIKYGPSKLGITRFGNQYEVMFFGPSDSSFYFRLPSWRLIKQNIKCWLLFIQVWPVYVVIGSRDCDMCESESAYKFPTYWHFHNYMNKALDWAEGPTWAYSITKKQYKEFKTTTRDRVMEAFENGNGSSIYV